MHSTSCWLFPFMAAMVPPDQYWQIGGQGSSEFPTTLSEWLKLELEFKRTSWMKCLKTATCLALKLVELSLNTLATLPLTNTVVNTVCVDGFHDTLHLFVARRRGSTELVPDRSSKGSSDDLPWRLFRSWAGKLVGFAIADTDLELESVLFFKWLFSATKLVKCGYPLLVWIGAHSLFIYPNVTNRVVSNILCQQEWIWKIKSLWKLANPCRCKNGIHLKHDYTSRQFFFPQLCS